MIGEPMPNPRNAVIREYQSEKYQFFGGGLTRLTFYGESAQGQIETCKAELIRCHS